MSWVRLPWSPAPRGVPPLPISTVTHINTIVLLIWLSPLCLVVPVTELVVLRAWPNDWSADECFF